MDADKPARIPAMDALLRADEAAALKSVADYIAATAHPQDSRLNVAYAIALHLGLGWEAAQRALESGELGRIGR